MGVYDGVKEVYFYKYCKTCINRELAEHEDPCHDCLNEPSNVDSHKPVYYEKDENVKVEG